MDKSIRDIYVQYRTNPDNDDKSDSYFCSAYGFALDELRRIIIADKKLRQDILKARREVYDERMAKVDEALFRAAERGDTKAADLLYRRFDGWNPKIVEETNNFYNFTDIVKKLATEASKKQTVILRELPIEDD
jgi:hypothetical protein